MAILQQTKLEMRMIPWWVVHATQLRTVHHMPFVGSAYKLAVQHACLQLQI